MPIDKFGCGPQSNAVIVDGVSLIYINENILSVQLTL